VLYSPLFPTAPPPAHIPTLSLHDALPISLPAQHLVRPAATAHRALHRSPPHQQHVLAKLGPRDLEVQLVTDLVRGEQAALRHRLDRKSTRLNSSHVKISYAVFCLKKKKNS